MGVPACTGVMCFFHLLFRARFSKLNDRKQRRVKISKIGTWEVPDSLLTCCRFMQACTETLTQVFDVAVVSSCCWSLGPSSSRYQSWSYSPLCSLTLLIENGCHWEGCRKREIRSRFFCERKSETVKEAGGCVVRSGHKPSRATHIKTGGAKQNTACLEFRGN